MIVMKFGGTSVESAEAIQRVTGIVKSRLDRRPIVVVSAMGKTTNRLLKIADLAVSGRRDEALRELIALRDFHLRESGMERTVDEHFQELSELVKGLAVLGELTPRSIDAISSFGERLSSLIVTNYFQRHGLSAVHVDSRKMIVTDRRHTQAVPLLDQTYAKLAAAIPPLAKQQVVVMGGFIASTESGVTTTLSPSRIMRVIDRGFRAARSCVQSKTISCVYRSCKSQIPPFSYSLSAISPSVSIPPTSTAPPIMRRVRSPAVKGTQAPRFFTREQA